MVNHRADLSHGEISEQNRSIRRVVSLPIGNESHLRRDSVVGREKVIDELAPAMIREIVPRGLLFTPDDGFGFGARSPLAILMVSLLLATFACGF